MKKDIHKVSFTARKETVVPVKFKTSDRERVSFKAHKEVEQPVSFYAKNDAKKRD